MSRTVLANGAPPFDFQYTQASMLILLFTLLLYISLATWRVIATSQHLQREERAAWVVAVIALPIVGLLAYAVLRASRRPGLMNP